MPHIPFFRSNLFAVLQSLYFLLLLAACTTSQKAAPPMAQAPSPMEEHIRAHERIMDTVFVGEKLIVDGMLSRPVTLYLPEGADAQQQMDLLIHFHGSANIPIQAVDRLGKAVVLAVVNQGGGSSVYQRAFQDSTVFTQMLRTISEQYAGVDIKGVYCSAFSAGYGAVRQLLKTHADRIDGILLLDGLHTDYIPEATPLARGGSLNAEKMEGFLQYAREAVAGRKKMLITHSEIFPGTYASTTETTQWLVDALSLKRQPVLAWGPLGMQQTALVEAGQLQVRSFAGNSAPDHIDHFHGMTDFLQFFWQD